MADPGIPYLVALWTRTTPLTRNGKIDVTGDVPV